MTILADIQQLDPGHKIELYEVDCTSLGGDVERFHAHLQTGPIVWAGNTYNPWPVTADGFARTGDASQPTPTLTVSNVDGSITALCLSLADLVGAKVTRHRTLAQYLDGQPGADSTQELPPDVWYVDQKTSENDTQVVFSLSSVLDLSGRQLPARQVVANLCQWQYRSTECGYVGTAYFDKDNNPVSSAAQDVCGKRVSSCKCRFGATSPLSFGGFPAAGTSGTL